MCLLIVFFFFLMTRPLPRSTLFPYTTLFRSVRECQYARSAASASSNEEKTVSTVLSILTVLIVCCISSHLNRNGTFGKKSRSEEHTSELQSRENLVCRLLLEKKNHHEI